MDTINYTEQCPLCNDKGWHPISTWHSGYEKRPCELCAARDAIAKHDNQIEDFKVTLRWALMHIDPTYVGMAGNRIKAAKEMCNDISMEFR